ncbi:anaphase-promoting complex subunit 2 isoform X2 [Chrysoperla carnea]|uniref:anaphase-promoting complex subunit 2 isoform X2 n=1 Tax=Chrysoperla carnea TaxID=189513 RepID=UPI001D092356|nr:anaphase-promoting complex subunit 2 isoform X2 [Chrysoperla carnea]
MESQMGDNYDLYWEKISAAFPILNDQSIEIKTSPKQNLNEAVEIINRLRIKDHVIEIILGNIQSYLRRVVVPKFWSKLQIIPGENDTKIDDFANAVRILYDDILQLVPIIDQIQILNVDCDKTYYGQSSLRSVLKLFLHGTLFSQLPYKYNVVVSNFYEICLKIFSASDLLDDSEKLLNCRSCNYELSDCQCQQIISTFQEINKKLLELDLMERLVIQEVISLIYNRIETHIKETCKNVYDVSYLKHFENWLKTVVMSWLTQIYCGSSIESIEDVQDEIIRQNLISYHEKLTQFLYETYLKIIIDQLFCIIIEYPDSQPIIDDIRLCLPKTDLRSTLTTKLQQALKLRLLHQGVSTPDILTAFIAAIRALRRLDPTGVLLDTVTEPVRKYLRSRDDTVRCVVTNLTEEGSSELADELVKGEALQLDDAYLSDEDSNDWETWMPDPIDADPTKTSKTRRTSDIISMLVNIFGSKELFVNEYRTLLADRLLSQSACNTEKEIRYLELLKVRFGDSQLHYCEVMLKDICDSKRLNANLQNDVNYMEESKGFPATALILSAQFWPPFKEETFELLPDVKKQFELYTKGFEALKGNRTLCWKPHLGFVELEIELENRTLNLTVSPMLATIIMHFQEKSKILDN